jgi:hypothetical protein
MFPSEYQAWNQMRQRCCNPKDRGFRYYGGRGICVSERWQNSFEAFFADMGPKPGPGYSLDRIDNSANYEPGNCRWATRQEQARNMRSNRLLAFGGRTMTLADWAQETGIAWNCLWMRLKYGWSVEDALTVHPRGAGPRVCGAPRLKTERA